MSALIVPLLYPHLAGLLNFSHLFQHNFRVADDTFRNSHAAVRTDLVLAYSRRTKSSIAWLTSWARSCWVQ